MKKKVKIHMLPTGDITGIVLHSTGLDKIVHTKESELNAVLNIGGTSQHLYLTSDEKIEEGWKGWAYKDDVKGKIFKHFYTTNPWYKDARKIVATTDKSLKIYESETLVSASGFNLKTDDILLPQIPQSFIKEYVKSGGKIDEVEIEYTDWCDYDDDNTWGGLDKADLRIKVDSNNCVSIHTVKDSWNREEVIKILKNFERYLEEYLSSRTSIVRDNWIKENL